MTSLLAPSLIDLRFLVVVLVVVGAIGNSNPPTARIPLVGDFGREDIGVEGVIGGGGVGRTIPASDMSIVLTVVASWNGNLGS